MARSASSMPNVKRGAASSERPNVKRGAASSERGASPPVSARQPRSSPKIKKKRGLPEPDYVLIARATVLVMAIAAVAIMSVHAYKAAFRSAAPGFQWVEESDPTSSSTFVVAWKADRAPSEDDAVEFVDTRTMHRRRMSVAEIMKGPSTEVDGATCYNVVLPASTYHVRSQMAGDLSLMESSGVSSGSYVVFGEYTVVNATHEIMFLST